LQATSELNELTKFVRDADNRLQMIDPVGIDPEAVVKLLHSHKVGKQFTVSNTSVLFVDGVMLFWQRHDS
jgi:hypothetical protein